MFLFHVARRVADLQAHRVRVRDLPRPGNVRLAQTVHVAALQEPRDFRCDLSRNSLGFGSLQCTARELLFVSSARAIEASLLSCVGQMRYVERRDFLPYVRRPELSNGGERHAPLKVPADVEPIDRFAFMGSQQRRFQSGTALFDVSTQFGDEFCWKRRHAVALLAVAGWQGHASMT